MLPLVLNEESVPRKFPVIKFLTGVLLKLSLYRPKMIYEQRGNDITRGR